MTRLLINIDVEDLKRATDFYTGAFDLRVGRRLGDRVVELLGAEAPIYLLMNPRGSKATAAAEAERDYGRHWTPVHLDFVVEDVDIAVARACGAGAVLEDAAVDHAWGRIAHLADPFGNGFCLLAFRNRGYDEVAEGQ